MRNEKGQFIKGHRPSPSTEFQPGQHWRQPKPFRERDYLSREYAEKHRSTGEIAQEWGVAQEAIVYWLKKHEIPRRTIAEARKVKHWGSVGPANPMFGRNGSKSHTWKGGCTPERQAFYLTPEWKEASRQVWRRDRAVCRRCGKKARTSGSFHIHHIVSFSVKKLRSDVNNLVLLCRSCHSWVHSKKNIQLDLIKRG